MKNKNIGSSFNDFLEKEDLFHEVEAGALKKYFAALVKNKMEKDNITKTKLASIMHTSRSAVDRLLDPTNTSITLHTMECAAKAVGKKIKLELV